MALNLLNFMLSPCPRDWLAPPASDFSYVVHGAIELADQFPHLLQMVADDLERHALAKKKIRAEDRVARHKNHPLLPGAEVVGALPLPETVSLEQGRPCMNARTCFIFSVIRGYLGGLKSKEARNFLAESLTLHRFLASENIPVPSLSTIGENINKLTRATLEAILDAQIQWVEEKNLDDFADITVDSTAIKANSCWPTDSKLLWKLSERLLRNFHKMSRFNLPILEDEELSDILVDMHRLDFEIACAAGKKSAEQIRAAKYFEVYELAEAASRIFAEALAPLMRRAGGIPLVPSRREKLTELLAAMGRDIESLDQVLENSARRVLGKEDISGFKRVTSIADPDAAFITKGQRETNLGYRPQVSRSASGFIVAVEVPKGNAADADQLRPICEATIQRTGVVPRSMSVDDGYSSVKNLSWLKEKGVVVTSFSGAKGKKITPSKDWESEPYREARRKRSAVESSIFQLKSGFDFGRVVRRGIEKVREELTSKVIAFNFYRQHFLTRQLV